MSEGRRSWMAAGLVAVLGLWAAGAWGIETQSCTDDPSACGPTGSDDPPANQNDPPANQGNGGGGDGDGGQPPPDREVPFAPGLTLEIRDGQPYRVTDRTGQAVHHFDRNPDCSDPNTPGCTDGEDPAVRIHPCEMDNTRPECANFGTNLSPADMNEPLPPGTETCEGVFAEAAETGPETGVDAEGEECACGDEGCQCGPTLKERFQAAVEGAVDDAMYQTNRYLLHETERLLNTCDAFDSFRLPGLRDLPRFGDMFGGGMYYNQGGLLGACCGAGPWRTGFASPSRPWDSPRCCASATPFLTWPTTLPAPCLEAICRRRRCSALRTWLGTPWERKWGQWPTTTTMDKGEVRPRRDDACRAST